MSSPKEWIRRSKGALPAAKKEKAENPLTFESLVGHLFKSGIWLTIALVLLAVSGIGVAYLVRWIDPKTQIILAGFRGPSDQKTADSTALASEAADMFSDSLNQLLENGQSYSGSRGSALKRSQAQPFDPVPQVPISRTYGIEFQGISIDKIIAIWNQIRYKQETVTGDILPVDGEKRKYVLYLTWRTGHSIYHWTGQDFSIVNDEMEAAMVDAALHFVRETNPEIAGRYALSNGDYDTAIAIFSDWMKRNPQQPEPYWYIARTFDLQNEFVRALPFADRAQALLSHAPRGRRNSLQQGIYRIQALQYFLVWDPDVTAFQGYVDAHLAHDPDALTNLGLRYLQRGKLKNAEKTLQAALTIDPGDSVADGLLGETYDAGRSYPSAVKAFESQLKLDPSSFSAATNYVHSLNDTRDFATATAYCSAWVYPIGSNGVLTHATEADIYFWCAKAEEGWHPSRPDRDQPDRQRWYEAKALAVGNTAGSEMDKEWTPADARIALHKLVCTYDQSWSPRYSADVYDGIRALNDRLQKNAGDPKVKEAISKAVADCQVAAAKLQPVVQKLSQSPASGPKPAK